MASGTSGLLLDMPSRRYLQLRAEYVDMLGGDHKAALILYALGFRANIETGELPRGCPKPDSVTFTVNWDGFLDDVLLGLYSGDTVLHRMEYLKENGFVDFDVSTAGRNRKYTLNIAYTNECLYGERIFPPPPNCHHYAASRKIPASTENQEASPKIRASQPENSGQPARKFGPVPFLTKESSKESLNEGAAEENITDCFLPETPEAPTPAELPSVQLDDTIQDFIRREIRKKGKPPKFSGREGQRQSEALDKGESEHGSAEYRLAFLAWRDQDDDWLKKNHYPISHFVKYAHRFIPADFTAPRREAEPALPAIAESRPVSTDPPIAPSASKGPWHVAVWNRIVVSKPFAGPPPKMPKDLDFTIETWEKACEAAEKVIKAKGDEVSWMCLRWALKADPDNGDHWRKLAEGYYGFMAVMDKKQTATRDSKTTEGGMAMLMAKYGKPKEEGEDDDD